MVALPQPGGPFFLTDSGLETDLVFHHGVDLPAFAAFPMLETPQEQLLADYVAAHGAVASEHGLPIIIETPTWRANADWGAQLGYDAKALDRVNRRAVALGRQSAPEALVSGCLGPRGDGYVVGEAMAADQAMAYHRPQIRSLAEGGAHLVSALTLSYADEAVGIALAAREVGVPAVISFTVEVDGRLPDGTGLEAAVRAVDAATDGSPAYYMVNCAHPEHVAAAGATWGQRLLGLRANASRMSHAELDESEVLDDGDPAELAAQLVGSGATVLGGCCGTDLRHIQALAGALRDGGSPKV